jgi:coenzyme F420 hydrogenase subunit beta
MENNVHSEVVARNLCIGCGVCAAFCPKDHLEIRFNEYGEYNAFETKVGCLEKCDLCLKVCPFSNKEEDEDSIGKRLFANMFGINHTHETGYYLESFVGYSTNEGHRANGASGGIATWMMETLLKGNLVDQVACVSHSKAPNKLFEFIICKTQEEIRLCYGSCYYPVEVSQIVQYILTNEGRYAIILLPCFTKAFRLAMQVHPKLQQRVKFLLGLTCGCGKSKFFAEYACALGGGDPHNVNGIEFRIKNHKRPADEPDVRFVSNLGTEGECSGSVRLGALKWDDWVFTPNACSFCTDTFSELSDATFMDAWLPDYIKDYRGHNIIIVRERTLSNLLHQGRESDTLHIRDLSIDQVIESQKGLVHSKRNLTPERSRLAIHAGYEVPKTRAPLLSGKLPYNERLLTKAIYLNSRKSREEWLRCDKELKKYQKAMAPYARVLLRVKIINRLRRRPLRLFSSLWRCLLRLMQ